MDAALLSLLSYHFEAAEICKFPHWLRMGTLSEATFRLEQMDTCDALELVCKMRRCLPEQGVSENDTNLQSGQSGLSGLSGSSDTSGTTCTLAVSPSSPSVSVIPSGFRACLMRIEFGAMLERISVHVWAHALRPDLQARIAHESCLAACWTSMHAEHACRLQDGVMLSCEPSMSSIPSQFNELSIDHVLDQQIVCGSACKGITPLHELLVRCTSPATRGWNVALESAVLKDDGCVAVLKDALVVCLLGLHAVISPAARPHWRDRAVTAWRLQRELGPTPTREFIVSNPNVVKEAIRRRLVGTLESSLAHRHAMKSRFSLVASIGMPPRASLSRGIQSSMQLIAKMGVEYARGGGVALDVVFERCILDGSLVSGRWLSKVALRHSQPSMLQEAIRVSASAFRTHWASFCALCAQQDQSPKRLNPLQHDMLHAMNPVVAMSNSLDLADSWRTQRQVLAFPHLATLTTARLVREMCASACINRPLSDPSMSLTSLIRSGDPQSVAILLSASRLQWLGEQILSVDLGAVTRRKTSRVILRSVFSGESERATSIENASDAQLDAMLRTLPVHYTHLFVCTECRRIANAMPDSDASPNDRYSEIGTTATMISTDEMTSCDRRVTLHCAKRSSAAMRSATARAVGETTAWWDVPRRLTNADCESCTLRVRATTNAATQMWRDCKRAHDQSRTHAPCGEMPLLVIPSIGRSLRIYGTWYSICVQCGDFTRICYGSRIGSDIACTRCCQRQFQLGNDSNCTQTTQVDSLIRDRRCRYCSKAVPVGNVNSFKSYASPLDTFGSNRFLPPSLRVSWWCPMHQRVWLSSVLHTLSTNEVISHITERARPVLNLELDETQLIPKESVAQTRKRRSRSVAAVVARSSKKRARLLLRSANTSKGGACAR